MHSEGNEQVYYAALQPYTMEPIASTALHMFCIRQRCCFLCSALNFSAWPASISPYIGKRLLLTWPPAITYSQMRNSKSNKSDQTTKLSGTNWAEPWWTQPARNWSSNIRNLQPVLPIGWKMVVYAGQESNQRTGVRMGRERICGNKRIYRWPSSLTGNELHTITSINGLQELKVNSVFQADAWASMTMVRI